jgi:hypothetical protein
MSLKSKKTKALDEEWKPPLLERARKKSKSNKSESESESNSFLDAHSERIFQLHQQGVKPKPIAAILCTESKLTQGAIKPKQISNWLDYRKKKGGKTYTVSLKHHNLYADDSDCM